MVASPQSSSPSPLVAKSRPKKSRDFKGGVHVIFPSGAMEKFPNITGVPRVKTKRSPRILIVEDDGNDVELIQRCFKDFSPSVSIHTAHNRPQQIDGFRSVARRIGRADEGTCPFLESEPKWSSKRMTAPRIVWR